MDDAYRNAEPFTEFFAEVVADGRHRARGGGGTDGPLPLIEFVRSDGVKILVGIGGVVRVGLWDVVEQAELLVRGGGYVFLGRGGLVQAEQHVGLPGGQPHFSHQHVVQLGRVSVLGGRQRLSLCAGFHGGQGDAPFSLGIRLCFQGGASEGDGHFLVGISRAGDGHVFPVGKDHVGTEYPVELGSGRPSRIQGDGGSQDAWSMEMHDLTGYLRRSSSRVRPVSRPSRLIRRVMMKTRATRMGTPMIRKPHQVMLPMATL